MCPKKTFVNKYVNIQTFNSLLMYILLKAVRGDFAVKHPNNASLLKVTCNSNV